MQKSGPIAGVPTYLLWVLSFSPLLGAGCGLIDSLSSATRSPGDNFSPGDNQGGDNDGGDSKGGDNEPLRFLYAANETSGNISVFGVGSSLELSQIEGSPFESEAETSFLIAGKGGSILYAVNQAGSAGGQLVSPDLGSVSVFDIDPLTGALSLKQSIAVPGGPRQLALHPSKDLLYGVSFVAGALWAADIAPDGRLTLRANEIVDTGGASHSLVVSPQGSHLYCVDILPTENLEIYSLNPQSGLPTGLDTLTVSNGPLSIIMNAAGSKAYVASLGGEIVSLDINSNVGSATPVSTLGGLGRLRHITLSPDEKRLFAAEEVDGFLFSILDPSESNLEQKDQLDLPGTSNWVQSVSNEHFLVASKDTNTIFTVSVDSEGQLAGVASQLVSPAEGPRGLLLLEFPAP